MTSSTRGFEVASPVICSLSFIRTTMQLLSIGIMLLFESHDYISCQVYHLASLVMSQTFLTGCSTKELRGPQQQVTVIIYRILFMYKQDQW